MADETVITELVIDARQAEQGSAAYVRAMKAAQTAYDKTIDQTNAATVAMEKQTTVMTGTAGSITSTAKAWERLKAGVDPAYQATKRMEGALLTADAAAKKLGVDQAEINRVMDLARTKHLGTAVAVEEGAAAAKLGATQWASLGHSARSAAESIAIGASPMQALTQQANHLSYAMSGPQGIIAATAGVRAAFGTWITTIPGLLTGAGVAAAAAVGAYLLATREDIKSADEVLQNHKTLIDEIAKAYPAAAEAAKNTRNRRRRCRNRLPMLISKTRWLTHRRPCRLSCRRWRSILKVLGGDYALTGSVGSKAFADISEKITQGKTDAIDLQATLGHLRVDPTLSDTARDFAKSLQDTANQAAKLENAIKAEGTVSDVIGGGHAVKTLADIAAGFKDVSEKAGNADTTIAKLFGDMGGGSGGFGVTRSLGGLSGSIQATLGQFEQIEQAVQNSRRNQLQGMLDLTKQFRDTTTEVDTLKEALASAGGKDNIKAFFGDVNSIEGANAALGNTVGIINRLFDAMSTGNAKASDVASGVDLLRKTLVDGGLGVEAVDRFIDSLVRARMMLDADTGKVHQLGAAVNALRDKTITVTVVTRQVGTGTQSTYDVPNQTGGTTGVGVTRYSSNGPAVSSTPIFNTSTNSWGYTQPKTYQDPRVLAQVNAMYPQRAAGGPISPNTPYWVGEKGPELVMPQSAGTVIPNAQSMTLANPQSAFTGQVATRETDRMWQLFMNIEANTRKTYEGVDKWATTSSYSGGSSSSVSSGSSSSGSNLDDKARQYRKVLATWNSNFAAAGIVGSGNIGYGAQGLGATPEQIARRIVYGMATGGIIGGDSRDTQKVEFFKRPSERVIIADNDQISDQRSGSSRSAGGGERPVEIKQYISIPGGVSPSKESLAELRRQTAMGVRDGLRSLNGR
ncbi:hypothetical protein [Mesorhizobium sp. LNJC391B00]|uniref:hypothetical protein n=1 Tax=Mesorhizobium sp. LNJC391B00 TaxID=1287273 RepID=UPI0003CEEAAE|nr:hypothetical protein [Mesorhizobium sp. LNJC391B00]ESY30029.1 hypothetical protein X749_14380 [Mesorhizobium sp. LNJC391B00]